MQISYKEIQKSNLTMLYHSMDTVLHTHYTLDTHLQTLCFNGHAILGDRSRITLSVNTLKSIF